ncbi:MAG: DUF4280 domain-containing protein [Pseudobutyrivibrio sp.]|nr:DUF4280 domain-containing protein [Pseudobutyrivibrio sp.]
MATTVVTQATMACSFGTMPAPLTGTNNLRVLAQGKPICVLGDAAPMVNIRSFGMCTSLANPTVAAATAAALGVLTPQPCIPQIMGSWMPAQSKVLVGGQPALTLGCSCQCAFAGTINIVNPGQVKVTTG